MLYDLVIIGCGVSGIATARWAKHAGLRFTVLEKTAHLGGVWVHNSYENLQLQTTKHSYAFSDMPMPDHVHLHPTREDIIEYLNNYVDHHGLRPYIQFNTRVEELLTREDQHSLTAHNPFAEHVQDRFHVNSIRALRQFSQEPVQIESRFVAISSGFYTSPKWADIRKRPIPEREGHTEDGISVDMEHTHIRDFSFTGRHKNYNFKDKNVVVIGNGPSGCDIAMNALDGGAQQVTVLYRSPRWILTRYFGQLSLNFLSNRLFLYFGLKLPRVIFIFVLYIIIFIPYFLVGLRYNLRLPKNIINRNNLTLNEVFLDRVNHEEKLHYEQIDKRIPLEEDGTHLYYRGKWGKSRRQADLIIHCTGYDNKTRFLKSNGGKIPRLIKRILLPSDFSVGCIGFSPSFNWVQVADLQARWFIHHTQNKLSPDAYHYRSSELEYKQGQDYFDLAYLAYYYCDELAEDLGIDSNKRWFKSSRHDDWIQ